MFNKPQCRIFIDVFYLESFSQLNTSRVDSREINENMYLVVRSLKNNNQKIVSLSLKLPLN